MQNYWDKLFAVCQDTADTREIHQIQLIQLIHQTNTRAMQDWRDKVFGGQERHQLIHQRYSIYVDDTPEIHQMQMIHQTADTPELELCRTGGIKYLPAAKIQVQDKAGQEGHRLMPLVLFRHWAVHRGREM